jgi:hypothetical protein
VYKDPENENLIPVQLPDNVIDEFLEEAAAHPAVASSKLSEQEWERLDQDLKIEELDQAIKQTKKNSSPRIYGISNKFIKKFWPYFRVPLFRYAKHCHDTGRLTDSFCTAKIRLIPKKGNLNNIANRGPISLLNCFIKYYQELSLTDLDH